MAKMGARSRLAARIVEAHFQRNLFTPAMAAAGNSGESGRQTLPTGSGAPISCSRRLPPASGSGSGKRRGEATQQGLLRQTTAADGRCTPVFPIGRALWPLFTSSGKTPSLAAARLRSSGRGPFRTFRSPTRCPLSSKDAWGWQHHADRRLRAEPAASRM